MGGAATGVGRRGRSARVEARRPPSLAVPGIVHSTTAIVVLVGLLVTAALALASRAVHDGNEDRLLQEQVREAAAVISVTVPTVEASLATASTLAQVSGGDPEAMRQAFEQVARRSQFASLSVWPAEGGEPILVVGSPPRLGAVGQRRADDFLERTHGTPSFAVLDLLGEDQPALGYGYDGEDPTGYVVYAESPLPRDRTEVPGDAEAFSGLDYGVYLGEQEDPAQLLFASTSAIPFEGRSAADTVAFGDSELLLVMTPTEVQGGGLLASLWAVVGAAGLLMTFSVGAMTERLLRRRDHANRLARENAELFEAQRSVAETLQHSLLPDHLPDLDGIELAVRYESGTAGIDVGGDWYDVMELDDGSVVFAVGDVSGRGIAAATIMAALRHSIRAYALVESDPSSLLDRLNVLSEQVVGDRFATVLVGVVRPGRSELTIAAAGHPPPLVVDAAGARYVPQRVGTPIGAGGRGTYEPTTVPLSGDSFVFMFTDGLYERRGETVDDGLERLRAAAERSSGGLEERIGSVLEEVMLDGEDDAAVLGFRWTR